MDKKPISTLFADENFSTVQEIISDSLPQEPIEWRRSYGRPPKTVYVEVSFLPFNEDILPVELDRNLIGRPLFHIFWTDCNDIDVYKNTVKEDLSSWFMKLKARNISDWLVVVVTPTDPKKVNKSKLLSRSNVTDKIKNDFCGKSNERCVSVVDPYKPESRNGESWQALMIRLRQLMLQAYNRQLVRFEENMRAQREKRNEATWSFCQFFMLQEELAFVFEMLGLYEDSLVQYDELDALFTQFVLNSNAGETPEWLNSFIKPCDFWDGLSLSKAVNDEKCLAIAEDRASLLDLRNYLFSRQCALLLLLCRPWEVAQRSMPFMHNCVSELHILEITMPPGSVACWVFLSCLEVLHTCERFNDSAQVEAYSLYTASLWAYAREKLHELGLLCGLMPDDNTTSKQLQTVVDLLSGMKQTQECGEQKPREKLQEALSSKETFQKHYLEMSELAMGTYKHIGRIRSARLIGKDLAMFYLRLKEPEKAIVFMTDALKTYKEEQWDALAVQIQLDIAKCQKILGLTSKYIRSCAQIASSKYVDPSVRKQHFQKILELADQGDAVIRLRTEEILMVPSIKLSVNPVIITGSPVVVELEIISNLPEPLSCKCIHISVREHSFPDTPILGHSRTASSCSVESGNSLLLELQENVDYLSDRSLNVASLTCSNLKQVLQRERPQFSDKEYEITKDNFSNSLKSYNVVVNPGSNTIPLEGQMEVKGHFTLGQLSLQTCNLEFVLEKLPLPELTFQVVCENPSVVFQPCTGELVAGVRQKVELIVNSGSFSISQGTRLKLFSSSGLLFLVSNNEEVDTVEVKLPELAPFQKGPVPLTVISKLGSGTLIEHKILLDTPWFSESQEFVLNFIPAFTICHKLLTSGNRKFLQILLQSSHQDKVQLTEPSLKILGNCCIQLNEIPIHSKSMMVSFHQSVSYMWQLGECLPSPEPIQFDFSIYYQWQSCDVQYFTYNFHIKDFVTLYVVKSRVEPGNGVEFCRAGSMCHLHINIMRNLILPSTDSLSSLLYEIIAEQSAWNVCGRTAGVVKIGSSGCEEVTLNVMPLIGGYLPLPGVKLAKYLAAEPKDNKQSHYEVLPPAPPLPRLESFGHGQVFNFSQAVQVHVLPAPNISSIEVSVP